ncbi:hypothetical protein ACN4EG_26540 [Alkalinema pantanalense CENA528]|uniref:hypothetical protein n=1 Tax=Alkalinema pantanalense TaxID=1620705 RepID=UPI003D6E3D8C
MPFAALGQTDNPERTLRDAVRAMKQVENPEQQHELLGAAYFLGGLVLERELIGQIIRRDVMRESVTYQAVLEEGREEGRQAGREEGRQEGREEGCRSLVISLLREGADIDLIVRATSWSMTYGRS